MTYTADVSMFPYFKNSTRDQIYSEGYEEGCEEKAQELAEFKNKLKECITKHKQEIEEIEEEKEELEIQNTCLLSDTYNEVSMTQYEDMQEDYEEEIQKLKREIDELKEKLDEGTEQHLADTKKLNKFYMKTKEENEKLKKENEELKETYFQRGFDAGKEEYEVDTELLNEKEEENEELKEENEKLKKENKKFKEEEKQDYDDKYHNLTKPLEVEITYKLNPPNLDENLCGKSFDDNQVSVDTISKDYDANASTTNTLPIGVFWDYNNDKMNHIMRKHYSFAENAYDQDVFMDFTWMKEFKKLHWKKGKKVWWMMKSNGSGYFNVWKMNETERTCNHYLDEEGYIYINLFTRRFNHKGSIYERIDCTYNWNLNIELGRDEYWKPDKY